MKRSIEDLQQDLIAAQDHLIIELDLEMDRSSYDDCDIPSYILIAEKRVEKAEDALRRARAVK